MGQVRTPGTRVEDALEREGFGVGALNEFVRDRFDGAQPVPNLRAVLSAVPKTWLVAAVIALGSLLLSSGSVILRFWSKTDERQDAAIAALTTWRWEMDSEFKDWSRKVNYFIVIAERADKKLDDMREETLREYQAQARDRGDRSSVKRLEDKLAAIERDRAKRDTGQKRDGS